MIVCSNTACMDEAATYTCIRADRGVAYTRQGAAHLGSLHSTSPAGLPRTPRERESGS